MKSLRESIQTHNKLLLLIAVVLTLLIVLGGRYYFDLHQENQALKIKILSMNENKKTPKPWADLTAKLTPPAALTVVPAKPVEEKTNPNNEEQTVSLSDQETQALALKLSEQLRRPRNLELEMIENNIAIANEIISREPDSYSAYKAKLISLLVKEGKFNQEIDDEEVDNLLTSMAQFNISSDKLARREAALIAESNDQIQNAETQLDELASAREELESKLANLDSNDAEFVTLNNQLQQLEARETQLLDDLQSLQTQIVSNSSQLVNEDLVEVPFRRMLAKGEYDSVIDNAQNFIEEFPDSSSGYFYLIRALELQGQKEEALNIIQNSKLPPDVQSNLIQKLETESAETPDTYWQNLSF